MASTQATIESKLIIGWKQIARHCDRSVSCVRKWDEDRAFPVARLPDGRVAITTGLIDQWLLARRAEHGISKA